MSIFKDSYTQLGSGFFQPVGSTSLTMLTGPRDLVSPDLVLLDGQAFIGPDGLVSCSTLSGLRILSEVEHSLYLYFRCSDALCYD